MESRQYEITYIIRPDVDESNKKQLVSRFDSILTDNGAKLIDSKDWQKRRFAYAIDDYTEGIYHVINLTTEDATALSEFDRFAKYNENILRHMIVKR